MWLTEKERVTLAVLGGAALLGLAVLIWQQQHPSLTSQPGLIPPYAEWDAKLDSAKRVNINYASAEELERLPEIGPSMAKRIVDYRQAHGLFRTPEELLNVQGIGPATLQGLRDYIALQ